MTMIMRFPEGKIVHNPTSTNVWIGFVGKDEAVKVPSGQTIKL